MIETGGAGIYACDQARNLQTASPLRYFDLTFLGRHAGGTVIRQIHGG
jgi:hypothetical protein